MSGGFFRGTSAEQDTRFSNKQAKLMKSQKFAPELDHLVDMTKVNADVMRPWIAKRVTELLGFEDEVLINFIYGLLDGKVVNGKEVQISLTGFMEKNTGKFMKELWSLLLTAQANTSGVPQQFLDAKAEETRKRKEESDRIANEIQKKKEGEAREYEEERSKRMAGGVDRLKAANAVEPNSKQMLHRTSIPFSEDENEPVKRNGLRRRSSVSRSPNSADRSPSLPRGTLQSISRSRSQSVEIGKSRSISGSPQRRHRSISSERGHRSRRRQSITPRRRRSPRGSISPSRRRSLRFRQRSTSRSHRRSPSPIRRRQRSPYRRGSLSPLRRRSLSPIRRRPSPVRRRSPSPLRRRSPYIRRRSPSPMRRRLSPTHRRSRSPVRRRSPVAVRRGTPSPLWRKSPTPIRRRSPSPVRRRRRRSSSTPHRRSPSPVQRRSSNYVCKRSASPSRAGRRSSPNKRQSFTSPGQDGPPSLSRKKSPMHLKNSSLQSPRQRTRTQEDLSPARRASLRDKVNSVEMQKGLDSVASRPLISLRSPQRDLYDKMDSNKKSTYLSPSQNKSPSLIESPRHARRRSPSEDNWSSSPHQSPVRQRRESSNLVSSQSHLHKPRELLNRGSPETSGEEEESNYDRKYSNPKSLQKESTDPSKTGKQKCSNVNAHYKEVHSPDRVNGRHASETPDKAKFIKDDRETKSEKFSGMMDRLVHPDQKMSESLHKGYSMVNKRQLLDSVEGYVVDEKMRSHSKNVKDNSRHIQPENVQKLKASADGCQNSRSLDSGSGGSVRHNAEVKGRRKHKRPHRKEVMSDDDYSSESEIDERKEAKRRRKEEKRSRKEERRLRREERRRRKDERRAEKLKLKSRDTVLLAAGSEKNQHDACALDDEHDARHNSHSSDAEEIESEQKRLETELRKRALESLKAKKGLDC